MPSIIRSNNNPNEQQVINSNSVVFGITLDFNSTVSNYNLLGCSVSEKSSICNILYHKTIQHNTPSLRSPETYPFHNTYEPIFSEIHNSPCLSYSL